MRMSKLRGPLQRCLIGTGIIPALAFAAAATGAVPVVTFTPLTSTAFTLPVNGEAFVRYQVTNASASPRTLDMNPIVGVEMVSGSGNCSSSFVLASQQSCTLALHLIGSQIAGNINGGPVVCNSGSPLQCYQPSAANQLQVTLAPAQIAAISAAPAVVTIVVGSVATITVSNAPDATVPAQNLSVEVPPASSIVVDPGTCAAWLPPGASCQLQIGGTAAETATGLVISGSNTTSASVVATLVDDLVFEDGFDAMAGRK